MSFKALLVLIALFLPTTVLAQEPNPLCKGFIDSGCSCTHMACWEAEPNEVVATGEKEFGHDMWQYLPTGQTGPRKGWSPLKKAIVCAYNPGWSLPNDQIDFNKIGKGNDISCIYPVPSKELF